MAPQNRLVVAGLGLFFLAAAPAGAAAPTAGSPAPAKNATATPLRFGLHKDKTNQELEVRFVGKKKIAFKLTVSEPCKRTVAGSATSKGGDAESDEAEDGVSYFVNEYKYTAKDGCYFAIRIDADDKRHARVVQADCKSTCSPSDEVMTKRP